MTEKERGRNKRRQVNVGEERDGWWKNLNSGRGEEIKSRF